MIRYRPKFLRNDPGFMILLMVFKLFITMTLFICIGYFLLGLEESILIWSCFYVAFGAISCSIGSIEYRKKIFIEYSIAFIVAIFIAGLIHPYPYLVMISIIIASFFAYWVRRFGAMYLMFPSFIVICYMISALQLPIEKGTYIQAITGALISGILFYLIVLKWLPWDIPRQLSSISENFLKLLYQGLRKTLYDPFSTHSDRVELEKSLLEQAHDLHDKGSLWIVRPHRKELWIRTWSDMDALIRRFQMVIDNLPEVTQQDLQTELHKTLTLTLLMLRNLVYSQSQSHHQNYCQQINAQCENISVHLMKFQCHTYIPDIELNACYNALASLRKLPILMTMMANYLEELKHESL